MRVLLDTHAFLWWVADSRRLSGPARDAIRNEANDVVVSAVSVWEIATKHRLGRLPEVEGSRATYAEPSSGRASASCRSASPTPNAPDDCRALTATPSIAC